MATAYLTALLILFVTPQWAWGHYQPGTHNAVHAIQLVWCGRSNVSCWRSREAVSVAVCESGSYWDRGIPTQARNGIFVGMFQMGSYARGLYGHGPDPWSQARAAHRYWLAAGWRPWECQPG